MGMDEALQLVLDIDEKRQRKAQPFSRWSKAEKEASDLIGRICVFGTTHGKEGR